MILIINIVLVCFLILAFYLKNKNFRIGKFKNIIGFSSGLIIAMLFIYFLNLLIRNYSTLEHFNLTLLLWGFVLIFILKQYILTEVNKFWEVDLMLNKVKFIEYSLSAIFLVFLVFIVSYLSEKLNFVVSFAFVSFLIFYILLLEINSSKLLEKAYFKPTYKHIIPALMFFTMIVCVFIGSFIQSFYNYMLPFIIGFLINSMFDIIVDRHKTYDIVWFVSGIVVANLILLMEFLI